MSAEDNLKIVQSYLANHDPRYMAEGATFRDYTQAEPVRGRKAIGEMLDTLYHTAFSEAVAETRHVFADDTSVVLEFMFRGVNTGPLGDMPPTGKRVEVPMCAVYEVEGGQIVRGHLYYDSGTMARQLGWQPSAEDHPAR